MALGFPDPQKKACAPWPACMPLPSCQSLVGPATVQPATRTDLHVAPLRLHGFAPAAACMIVWARETEGDGNRDETETGTQLVLGRVPVSLPPEMCMVSPELGGVPVSLPPEMCMVSPELGGDVYGVPGTRRNSEEMCMVSPELGCPRNSGVHGTRVGDVYFVLGTPCPRISCRICVWCPRNAWCPRNSCVSPELVRRCVWCPRNSCPVPGTRVPGTRCPNCPTAKTSNRDWRAAARPIPAKNRRVRESGHALRGSSLETLKFVAWPSLRGISNYPKQLFIGQGRDAPGLGDLVLVIEVENC